MKKASHIYSLGNSLGNASAVQGYASFPERLHHELTSRQLPLFFDYLQPQQSHLLNLTLTDLFPKSDLLSPRTTLPTIARPSHLPPAHHLVYFPPQVTLSQLLADGTDTLHTPGAPFNRRLWAGGGIKFAVTNKLRLDGGRAVCIERIRDVMIKGQTGEEKIIVRIERQIGTVQEEETEHEIRKRVWSDGENMEAHTSILENRDLVFMRDKTADQLVQDKASFSQTRRMIKSPTNPVFRYQMQPTRALLFRFSALTFNAHSIHLDNGYTSNIEGYRNLLVHGPLTLTLLVTALRHHLHGGSLDIIDIKYKNLAPLFVEEQLVICGKPKPTKDSVWDLWIEGKDGGVAVRGTAHLGSASDN
ncbi:uncharacterized protein DSM5745_10587 [Aspergillus mulundensis]|uniref:MaoC-like domain-containing protein n=1 Tax=Aspergillus mulundensis TaxID=1810919 RepID=A0A3D8QJD2_9EURO|nr:Uncharacterized protein DSM5745_10587 [Aspergillus mulundensis]RDW61915.1 Uncharacterized protein DSM5745_10587 [Aspergillus mulundensis]